MAQAETPKYYRQRFLLALLELAAGKLSKIDLQKLLFLSKHEAGFNYFDFVPYHFGCYSFQAQADLTLLANRGWIYETQKHVQLKCRVSFGINDAVNQRLQQFMLQYQSLRGQKLLSYVYERYPYYAMRSRIADKVLSKPILNAVKKERDSLSKKETLLYTIGYEGLLFETYINHLIQNDVRLLCDVRKNPLSRKFGFSKSTLKRLLPKFGISYLHIPELGIHSELRQKLETAEDYEKLFSIYQKQLPKQKESLEKLEKLLNQYRRIALTCFEKEHRFCHRHCVSDYLKKKRSLKVCHL